jgi:tRNA threonylcarbamoyladenosine biosynthesis protein TsaE
VVAQGIGAGLRVTGAVTSPTFVVARVHRPDPARGGTIPLVHVDAYRLGAVTDPRAEVDDLDLDAVVEDAVVIVEWGEGMVEHLADAHLLVRLDRREDEVRMVELIGRGGDWSRRLTEVDGVRSGA